MNPRRLTPSMSLLLAFEASARHLSFTRAATELALTQSAVSRQVQALEDLLEVALFRREKRRIVLTEAGTGYQKELAAALQRIRSASLQAISHRTGRGAFHLAALPTFTAKWLMPRLHRFYARHPGILVHLHSRVTRFDLDLAGIDAVIAVGDGDWPGLVPHRLMNEHVIPVISPDIAARQTIRGPADLVQHVLLQVAARPAVWQRWFESHGLPVRSMRWGAQFELTTHLIQAVASGLGVGLLPTFLVEDELRQGVLAPALDEEFSTGAGYFFLASPDKLAIPAVAAFRDWLLDESAGGDFQR
ncbi:MULTISPECIES: LysR substrate-binding domain-containing protein [Achromobacter]|uniref:LysR substrate-binding domain-containing protein n=1 Tax=Achromobacter TaxID=222 RepID=UPI0025C37D5D|nr:MULTISPECIES: LysR substrate-binding domain-containing protein [Achromobacter]